MRNTLIAAVSALTLAGGLSAQAPVEGRFPVTSQRLVNAASESHNWLMYSGQYNGQRFSLLDQIDRGNVAGLEVKWAFQLETLAPVETAPIIVDGLMFVTQSPSTVIALDAETGRPYWTFTPDMPEDIRICCGPQNRGVAVLGDRVFVGTLDARLIALDAATGDVRWAADVGEHDRGYSITGAPLAVGDKIVTGIAGGEFGIRGHIDAYDAETGARVWRTYTIPAAGEPGNETWAGDSWQYGGAPTWVTGSYDPALNLIYWGTGNPGPDWNGDDRAGDNLCSDCVLALNADNGEIVWQFQFTPHDVHDWDATQVPILMDAQYEGRQRKLLLTANRNAFYYVLDRETGEFLHASSYAKQTWAQRIDSHGRPVRTPGRFPSKEGTEVFPSVIGGTNWWSPSYSPETDLFYVTALDGSHVYFKEEVEYRPGRLFMGGSASFQQPVESYRSFLRAINRTTGDVKWEHEMHPISQGGVLSTAGDLVFSGGSDGFFFALDATSGEVLWRINLGGEILMGPVSYAVDGRQYITVAAGSAIFTVGLN